MNTEVDFVSISETESSEESDFLAMEDDSEEDPTFDLIQDAQKSLSKLSIKKKKKKQSGDDEEIEISHLDENGVKSLESIEKLIHDGKLEKLKMEDYKTYLKRYGLRLTGNKQVLQERVQKHIEVKNGDGERKYPISSFVKDCQGDSCKGDVVMFTQLLNKVEKKESKNAKIPETRTVVGRIIRESYGTEKQQHTFTIEVLWSRGKKPYPPLYPLLIKGRNLYKLKTMRRKWENEAERDKILKEKHERGQAARASRERRIQEKENRIRERENRMIHMQNRIPVRSQKQHGAAPVLNRGPKLQERTNFTSNYNRIENQTNPNNNQSILGPRPPNYYSNPNYYPNNISVDQVHHLQRPVQRGDFSDRWDPRTDGLNLEYGGPGPRNTRREEMRIEYSGPGPRSNGGPVRRVLCKYFARGNCWNGQGCRFIHDN